MKIKCALFVLAVLLASVLVAAQANENQNSLQTLIDNCEPGGVLRLSRGVWTGGVLINKPITIIGESREATVVQTDAWVEVFRVNCSDVRIENLTINGGWIGVAVKIKVGTEQEFNFLDISNVTVSNLNIKSFYGVSVFGAVANVTIENCFITNSGHAISVGWSSGVTVKGCHINFSSGGIYFNQLNSNNKIVENTIENCHWGLILQDSWLNVVSHNTISYNHVGIHDTYNNESLDIPKISGNQIYLNNIINNTIQVQLNFNVIDQWCHASLKIGNYWSDYTGQDENLDGVGDTPYIVGENNIDLYPLMFDPNPRGQRIYTRCGKACGSSVRGKI